MNFDVRHLLLGLAIGGFGQGASALGFGALPSSATLGQALDLRVPLRLEPGEDVAPECVSAEVQFGETVQQRGTTTATLEPALPGARERTVRVLTTTRIAEPVVTVEIVVGCAARSSRRFTLFADPPLYTPPASGVAAASPGPATTPGPAAASSTTVAAAASPPAAQASAAPPRRAAKRTRPRTGATAPAPARTPTTASAAPRAPATPAVPVAVADSTSRLKLATLEEGANPGATAASAPSPELLAAAEAASAASAAAAAASARVAEVEASGVRLRAEFDKAQQTINELKTRLQQGEAARSDEVLVYGLGGLALLLAALLIWMWRQREQEREASAWLEQAAAAHPRPGTPEGDAATAEAMAFAPQPSAPLSAPVGFDDTQAASRAGLTSRPGGLGPISAPAPLAQERREVSVEELIDLEQQAEFFIVLGQDEAAIDLLMGHLRSTADTSPLPYLKLLEICKRRGDRKEYERLRERFNSRFSARAPEWETDLQGGLTLEDYPAVVRRLQSLWFQPQRAMEVLQATLLREPGDADTQQADSFDLPAYRELMLLYSVARDLSETTTNGIGAVDLLLPLDESGTGAPAPVFERLVATTSLEAQPSVHKPLEVDLPLDDADTGGGGSRS
ncbi:MAG TPA: hypothetical protein VLI72_03600 [Methylibium sp.]|nr:hypothetical protein [Methylibium sp.]